MTSHTELLAEKLCGEGFEPDGEAVSVLCARWRGATLPAFHDSGLLSELIDIANMRAELEPGLATARASLRLETSPVAVVARDFNGRAKALDGLSRDGEELGSGSRCYYGADDIASALTVVVGAASYVTAKLARTGRAGIVGLRKLWSMSELREDLAQYPLPKLSEVVIVATGEELKRVRGELSKSWPVTIKTVSVTAPLETLWREGGAEAVRRAMGTEAEGAQAHRLHSRPVSFDWDELRAEALSPSVALDSLPVWDGCEDGMGEDGMGEALTEQLAGGLRLGQSVVIGAPKAGGGKTAFVQQLVDGLALRNAARESGEALTPVFVFSEMRAAHWQYRSIARWAGLSYGAVLNLRDDMVDAEARRAAKALSYAAPYLRVVSTTARELRAYPDGFAAFVSRAVASWRRELEASEGGPVWPVVVVDPIQRLQNHEHQETEALNELAEELTEAARSEAAPENAFILIMTSDTTKGAKSENGGASVIRGSYKLFHSVDIAIALFERERENAKQLEKAGDKRRLVELDIAKNRWGRDGLGPRYLWSKHCGRFEETKEEPAKPKGKGRADSDKSAGPETNGKPQKSGFDL